MIELLGHHKPSRSDVPRIISILAVALAADVGPFAVRLAGHASATVSSSAVLRRYVALAREHGGLAGGKHSSVSPASRGGGGPLARELLHCSPRLDQARLAHLDVIAGRDVQPGPYRWW